MEISHDALMQGGTLTFIMGSEPKPSQTTKKSSTTLKSERAFAPVPFITTEQRVFADSLLIEIDVVRRNGRWNHREKLPGCMELHEPGRSEDRIHQRCVGLHDPSL